MNAEISALKFVMVLMYINCVCVLCMCFVCARSTYVCCVCVCRVLSGERQVITMFSDFRKWVERDCQTCGRSQNPKRQIGTLCCASAVSTWGSQVGSSLCS